MRPTNWRVCLVFTAACAQLNAGCGGKECGVWETHDVDPRLRKHTHQIAVGLGGALAESSPSWFSLRESGTAEELLNVWAHLELATPFVAVGRRGTIRVSEGVGKPWTTPSIQGNLDVDLRGVTFATFGVAVGDSGTVLVGTSQGMEWKNVSTPTMQHLNAAAIDADRRVTVVGENGTVLRSIDEGISWGIVQVPTSEDLLSILLLSRSLDNSANPPYTHTGYIVGTSGTLLYSSDGLDWVQIETNLNEDLRQVIAHNESNFGSEVPLIVGETSLYTWSAGEGQLRLKSNLHRSIHSVGQYLAQITALSTDGVLLAFTEPYSCELPRD